MQFRLALTTVTVFQFISPDHTQRLAKMAKVMEKGQRDAVLLAGEAVTGIYIVGEGSVGVYPPGAVTPIAVLGCGDSFGEMSFIENNLASATIRAEQSNTKLVVLLQTDLAELIESDPTFGRALYRGMAFALSRKLRHTTERISDEIKSSRVLFRELQVDEAGVSSNLGELPREVEAHHQGVVAGLETCRRQMQDLMPQVAERAGGQLLAKLEELKMHEEKFHPRLARRLASVQRFVEQIEVTLLQTDRETAKASIGPGDAL